MNEIKKKSTNQSRRKLVKTAAWSAPVVATISLPQHAQATTPLTTSTTTTTTNSPLMLTVGNETCLSGGAAGSAGSRIITNDMDVPIDIVSITGTGGADGYTVTSTAIGSTVAPDESFDISYALDGAGCPEAGAFVFETDCCGSFTFTI